MVGGRQSTEAKFAKAGAPRRSSEYATYNVIVVLRATCLSVFAHRLLASRYVHVDGSWRHTPAKLCNPAHVKEVSICHSKLSPA